MKLHRRRLPPVSASPPPGARRDAPAPRGAGKPCPMRSRLGGGSDPLGGHPHGAFAGGGGARVAGRGAEAQRAGSGERGGED